MQKQPTRYSAGGSSRTDSLEPGEMFLNFKEKRGLGFRSFMLVAQEMKQTMAKETMYPRLEATALHLRLPRRGFNRNHYISKHIAGNGGNKFVFLRK
jgi:hypothetical protein